ncbi:MAG: hypothetical protein R2764_08720 [Bacteroidales bacterium]
MKEEDTDNMTVTIDQETSINSQSFNEGLIRIYPNPATENLCVNCRCEISKALNYDKRFGG